MSGPLTYPPEISIESGVELPPVYEEQGSNDAWMDLIGAVVECLIELLFSF
jgi:hypothetical protein